jgi:nucleolar GTP-binding protein
MLQQITKKRNFIVMNGIRLLIFSFYLTLTMFSVALRPLSNFKIRKVFSSFYLQASTSASNLAGTTRLTGAFKKRLPHVFVSKTHFKRAYRNLKDIKQDRDIKNYRNRKRKFAAQSMDALMKGLTVPLTEILNTYKSTMRSLHPYEATVAELTITAREKTGNKHLNSILDDIRKLRAETSRVGKDFASRANNADTAIETDNLLEEGFATLEALYNDSEGLASSLAELVEIQKDLRKIPVIELNTPTVVLVGAPNVGKSSIVRSISTGTPEVNNYPFTTRGVTIGHIVDQSRKLRFQVMDTPGLLDRPADERNEMEKLTFASLAHLPTAVIFVLDPSGLSGEKSTVNAQMNVRKTLRERFPKRPWLDVVSKADLDVSEEILNMMPANYLHVSIESGHNVELLQEEIEEVLSKLKDMLLAMQNAQNSE